MKKILTIAFAMACSMTSVLAQGQVIYNAIPSPLAGNYPSQAFQAAQASEVGDRVRFSAGSGRSLLTATHTMSSWACQSGAWYSNDCVTTPGATFNHDITLNIYNVGTGAAVGGLIGTVTQTFSIPYRPSASPSCTGGRWSDGTSCFNGLAANITFNLAGLTVPNEVIYGIAYNTSNWGYDPIGTMPCTSTPQGCPYDSLNVAVEGTQSVGVNPSASDAYFNSQTPAQYCDGGILGTGTFRLDAGCWTGFKPFLAMFTAANAPTNANQCKNGGWQTRTRADGSSFRNQGDCIQFVNTGR